MPWGSCRQTWRREGLASPLPHHLVCVERFTLPHPYLRFALAPFGFRELPSANLKLTSPELAAARAMCLDYFLAVTHAVPEEHLCFGWSRAAAFSPGELGRSPAASPKQSLMIQLSRSFRRARASPAASPR